MKILHISTSDSGGAGLCCIRLHKSLLAEGINSRVIVLNKYNSDPEVYKFQASEKDLPGYFSPFVKLFLKILKKLKIPLSSYEHYQYRLNRIRKKFPAYYSLPFSACQVHNHPLVLEADLIHLHWITGFVNFPVFFRNINKPLVWTLHDEYLNYGGFHYGTEKETFAAAFLKLENSLSHIKQQSIEQARHLTMVYLSDHIKSISLSNPALKERDYRIIHNSVNTEDFRMFDRKTARDILRLPSDKKIILFVSLMLSDKRKGFRELVQALSVSDDSSLAVCAVGIPDLKPETAIPVYYTGQISDPGLMSLAYSAADLFVLSSYREAFAQTPLEALACGTPVVAFPCSGTSELIHDKNGVRATGFTVPELSKAISTALHRSYDREELRADVIGRFSPGKIALEYKELYKDVLSKHEMQ